MTRIRVTDHELRLMTALRVARERWPENEGVNGHLPEELRDARLLDEGASLEGAHQTAASLVRKRLVYRFKPTRRARVGYSLTGEGLILLAGLDTPGKE